MLVVSNTSPLLNLAIIDHLHLLRKQWAEVWVPSAVVDELRIEEALPGSGVLQKALDMDWLKVKPIENRGLVSVLCRDLDRGEAEAIALALQLEAERVLLDERDGRRIAKSLGLEVTGVLGILLRAKREGSLLSILDAITQLQKVAGFRIGQDLLINILRESEEV